VVFREHEPLTDSSVDDPHALLFGSDDGSEDGLWDQQPGAPSRSARGAHHRRLRRNRRLFTVVAVLSALAVILASYGGYRLYRSHYDPKDYSGTGTGSVEIVVHDGDGAQAIGDTLVHAGVVGSTQAFVNAVKHSAGGGGIAPGAYQLRKHMSAKSAILLLLDPAARLSNEVLVFPGATVLDVAPKLAQALKLSDADVTSALANVGSLGLPSGYTSGASLNSVEGFLYPATYTFDPGTSAQDAIQDMITKFIDVDRSTGFASKAKQLNLTPYAALTIASIAEKEAKNPADYPKVVRVILNRIAARMPLQIDATSAYAAKLLHLDPTKVVYADIDSPYNTYTHDGLPPTPIANPGTDAISASVHPASGNWLYYVNGDAKGDLFFTNDSAEFDKAVQKCHDNHWGCG
jgi:UPF0755 protein